MRYSVQNVAQLMTVREQKDKKDVSSRDVVYDIPRKGCDKSQIRKRLAIRHQNEGTSSERHTINCQEEIHQ